MATQTYQEDNIKFNVNNDSSLPVADKLTILQSERNAAYSSLYKLINAVDIDWNNAKLNTLLNDENVKQIEINNWGGETVNGVDIPEHEYGVNSSNWKSGHINTTGEMVDLLDYLLNRTLYFDNEILSLISEKDLTPLTDSVHLYNYDGTTIGAEYDKSELVFDLLNSSGTTANLSKKFLLDLPANYDGTVTIENNNPSICVVNLSGKTIWSKQYWEIEIIPVSTVKWENVPNKYKETYIENTYGEAPTIDYSDIGDIPEVSSTIPREISIKYTMAKTSKFGSYTGYIYVKTRQKDNAIKTFSLTDASLANQMIIKSTAELTLAANYLNGDNIAYRILPKFTVTNGGSIKIEKNNNGYKYYFVAPEKVSGTDIDCNITCTIDYPDNTYDLGLFTGGGEVIFTNVQRVNNTGCTATLTIRVYNPLQQIIYLNDFTYYDPSTKTAQTVSVTTEDIITDGVKTGERGFATINCNISCDADNVPYFLFNQKPLSGSMIAVAKTKYNIGADTDGYIANIGATLYGYTEEPDIDTTVSYESLGYFRHKTNVIPDVYTGNVNTIASYINKALTIYTAANNNDAWDSGTANNCAIKVFASTVKTSLAVNPNIVSQNKSVKYQPYYYDLSSRTYKDEWYTYAVIKLYTKTHYSGKGKLTTDATSYLYLQIKRSLSRVNGSMSISTGGENQQLTVGQAYQLSVIDAGHSGLYYYNFSKVTAEKNPIYVNGNSDEYNTHKQYEISWSTENNCNYYDFTNNVAKNGYVDYTLNTTNYAPATTYLRINKIYKYLGQNNGQNNSGSLIINVHVLPDLKYGSYDYTLNVQLFKVSLLTAIYGTDPHKIPVYTSNVTSNKPQINFETDYAEFTNMDSHTDNPVIEWYIATYLDYDYDTTKYSNARKILGGTADDSLFDYNCELLKNDTTISGSGGLTLNFDHEKTVDDEKIYAVKHILNKSLFDVDTDVSKSVKSERNIYKLHINAGETYTKYGHSQDIIIHYHRGSTPAGDSKEGEA